MSATDGGRSRVLVIDDEEVMQDVLGQLLGTQGWDVTIAADGDQGIAAVGGDEGYDLVLLDLMLPGQSGLEVLAKIKRIDPDIPVIMITAYATVETAIEAMRGGAFDYLVKPFRNDELLIVARRTIATRQLQQENRRLRRELRDKYQFGNIVGRSEPMQTVFDLIQQAAPSRSTILVTGESGTGKELVARAIHHASPRAEGPFVVVNSANLATEQQESALFGHVEGAFAGADRARQGLFEMADGGSVFFDEVANLSLDLQAKILRVLQEKEIVRQGSNDTRRVDVRIIAATNTRLLELVASGRFREDLYYRLKVISIPLPPLRDRGTDRQLLATHFLHKYSTENDKKVLSISRDGMRLIDSHDWPGNVRELENVIQKAVVLCRSDEIGPELIADDLSPPRAVDSGHRQRLGPLPYKELVDAFERDVILDALRESDGVQKRAAGLLGLKATTLNEKIKRLKIHYQD